jgi:hypothetical protein
MNRTPCPTTHTPSLVVGREGCTGVSTSTNLCELVELETRGHCSSARTEGNIKQVRGDDDFVRRKKI